MFKLNVDASVSRLGASGEGLLRNHHGNLVFAFYIEYGKADALMAESLSLLAGLQFCKECMIRDVLVEVDSKVLVQLVASGSVPKWSW